MDNYMYKHFYLVDNDHYYDMDYFHMDQLILDNKLLLNYLNIDIRI